MYSFVLHDITYESKKYRRISYFQHVTARETPLDMFAHLTFVFDIYRERNNFITFDANVNNTNNILSHFSRYSHRSFAA